MELELTAKVATVIGPDRKSAGSSAEHRYGQARYSRVVQTSRASQYAQDNREYEYCDLLGASQRCSKIMKVSPGRGPISNELMRGADAGERKRLFYRGNRFDWRCVSLPWQRMIKCSVIVIDNAGRLTSVSTALVVL